MASTSLRKPQIYKETDNQFAAIGFIRFMPGLYKIDLAPDVIGKIGLPSGRRYVKGAIDLLPIISISHVPLERLVEELSMEEPAEIPPGTLTRHIGYVMPEKDTKHWLYYNESDLKRETQSLVRAVQEYGLPYMQAHQTLESMLDPLNNTPASNPSRWRYQLPVALFLLERKQEALKLANQYGKDRPGDARYQKYLDRFTRLIKEPKRSDQKTS